MEENFHPQYDAEKQIMIYTTNPGRIVRSMNKKKVSVATEGIINPKKTDFEIYDRTEFPEQLIHDTLE